jgi:hypothetical protein
MAGQHYTLSKTSTLLGVQSQMFCIFLNLVVITSVMGDLMSVEQWWNDTDKRQQNYSEKNLQECHFVQQNLI